LLECVEFQNLLEQMRKIHKALRINSPEAEIPIRDLKNRKEC
jgi:hypothetical protein